ncbi:MAG: pyruvate kinase [Gemmatimonadetes bacterium]|nr:pyruvate kinase [Gemmatimonadota bacterium]
MRTKIVATLGPATDERDRIHALADLGVDVLRINFAHGSHETAARWIRWTREASDAVGRPLAVLADLAGPKIRIGALAAPVQLEDRTDVVLAPEGIAAPGEIPTTWEGLADDVPPGGRILLADGIMELRVRRADPPRVTCEVVRGGLLHAHKGMNLPGIEVSTPALTMKDRADLAFAIEHEVDYIGLSFVQRAQDVLDLRALIPEGMLIVAKIEKDRALTQLEPILAASDAVMVARGDLGVELPFEQVPLAQKRIVQFANLHGRPVITATQMLESMMEHPRPTRAEASDVANALFDGTDAVMLSGETAAGRFPLLAVDAMVRIASEIERSQGYGEGPKYDVPTTRHLRAGATPTEHAIAAAVVEAARMLGAPAIITLTRSGTTSRLVSSYRPNVPILGVTHELRTWRQLALVWGLHPVHCTGAVSYDAMLESARAYLIRHHIARAGQRVVVTAGVPFHVRGTTNMVRVEEL